MYINIVHSSLLVILCCLFFNISMCVCIIIVIHKRKLHQAMLVGGFGRGLFVTGAV